MSRHRLQRRRERGLSLIETVVATVLLVAVLGGAIQLLDASEDLASSATHQRNAAMRVERTLARMGEEFRRGSIASARHLDGSTFSDGETDTGFAIRPVTGWEGGPVLGNLVTYRLEMDAGAVEGELVRADGAVETVLATGITGFTVSRDDSVFTFTVTSRSGPNDDRGRRANGTLSVMARNP